MIQGDILYVRIYMFSRNTATESVKQELLFVGQESGKLLAMRNLVKKVRTSMKEGQAGRQAGLLNNETHLKACTVLAFYFTHTHTHTLSLSLSLRDSLLRCWCLSRARTGLRSCFMSSSTTVSMLR